MKLDVEEALAAGGVRGLLVLSGLGVWWAAVQLCELLALSLSLKLCEPAHQSEQRWARLNVSRGLQAGL